MFSVYLREKVRIFGCGESLRSGIDLQRPAGSVLNLFRPLLRDQADVRNTGKITEPRSRLYDI